MLRRTRKVLESGKKDFRLVWCAAFAALSLSVTPAQARDALVSQGLALYAKGQYVQARRLFEEASIKRPNYWPAFYHLANCDVKLKDFNRAEQEYKKVLHLNADAAVYRTCKIAIDALREHRNKPGIATKEKIQDKRKLVALQEAELDATRHKLAHKMVLHASDEFTKRRNAAIARQEQILLDGRKQAQAARDRAAREIQWLRENGNWICQNSATGAISVTIPSVIADEIEERGELEAQRILKDADNRARGVHIPEHDNTAIHMMHGITSKAKGTRIDHRGTNLYVRNYKHESDAAKKETAKLIAGSDASTK